MARILLNIFVTVTGDTLTIRYRSADGAETRRTITVLGRIGRNDGDYYLRAYCHLRKEERTFLASRILESHGAPTPAPEVTRPPPRDPVPPSDKPVAAVTPRQERREGRGGASLFVVALLVSGMWWLSENPELFNSSPPRPAPAPGPSPEYTARIASLVEEFVARTGQVHAGLTARYVEADANRDGELQWQEIRTFQGRLVREFEYRFNDSALPPRDFVSLGSGDCEDFALFTCGLLRFWGTDCYIGLLESGFVDNGHAIALVPVAEVPRGFDYFDLREDFALPPEAPRCFYVPIDYQFVGGLSNAVSPAWSLTEVRRPEELYGAFM